MRTIDSAAGTVLTGDVVPFSMLIEMMLSEPVRVTTADRDIVFGGNTYIAVGAIGSIETIDDSPGEYKGLKFTLSGVDTGLLAIALAENIRDAAVTVSMAVLDPITHAVLDAPTVWLGTLDQMPISAGAQTSTISVTAEHRGATYARPKPLRYTDADQQKLFPGDTSLRFITSQANHQDVWPAASFNRQ